MRLYHCTPYAPFGLVFGLSPLHDRRGKGRLWLCTKCHLPWAIAHVAKRHRVAKAAVLVLEVDVPSGWLVRHRRGIYFTRRWVPIERICLGPVSLI